MPEGRERRQHERLQQQFRVELSEFKFPLNRQPKIEVRCRDISSGGLMVDCSRRFAAGDKVTVKIYIPSLNKFHPGFLKVFESDAGQYLQAIAEIMWVEEMVPFSSYKIGLRFLDIDHDDWNALRNLIGKQLRSQKG